MEHVSVYSQDNALLAVLDNADDIGYDLKLNDLWTGSFTLPASDPKTRSVKPTTLCGCRTGPGKRGCTASFPCPAGK